MMPLVLHYAFVYEHVFVLLALLVYWFTADVHYVTCDWLAFFTCKVLMELVYICLLQLSLRLGEELPYFVTWFCNAKSFKSRVHLVSRVIACYGLSCKQAVCHPLNLSVVTGARLLTYFETV